MTMMYPQSDKAPSVVLCVLYVFDRVALASPFSRGFTVFVVDSYQSHSRAKAAISMSIASRT